MTEHYIWLILLALFGAAFDLITLVFLVAFASQEQKKRVLWRGKIYFLESDDQANTTR